MSMLIVFVCEGERDGTYILHMSRISKRYLPFGKSEHMWDYRNVHLKSNSVTV